MTTMIRECMTADVTGLKYGLNGNHRKEKRGLDKAWLVVDPNADGRYRPDIAPIEVKVYSTGMTTYACLWVNHNGKHGNGSGKASGGGYHKSSSAIDSAIESAGIKLSRKYGLSGDYEVAEALEAIGKACGIEKPRVFLTHP